MHSGVNKFKATKVGQLIFDRRMELQVSQGRLAEAFSPKVSTQFVSNIENGKCPLPVGKVAVVAEVLKMDPETIMEAVKADSLVRLDEKARNKGEAK